MKPVVLESTVECNKCKSTDTQAIVYEDDSAGVVWCECGYMDILITEGMEVVIKQA